MPIFTQTLGCNYDMGKPEFENQLKAELEKNKSSISINIDQLISNLTEKISGINIGIFTSQDGDGMFSIYANAIGPDLYVRQKEIKEYANLFDPKFTSNGIEPYIPTVDDPFEVDFDVNDCIVDLVALWLKASFSSKSFPDGAEFQIVGNDGYGTVTPLSLP
ncbi:MAG: DUF6389 family protein [Crocinitomicaceae bacterium]